MFLQLNWGILWPIINIIVFYLLLRKFLFGPVSEIMEKRKEMISKDLMDAKAAKDEAGKIVSDARERAKNEYHEKVRRADEEIVQMKENAQKDIEAEKQKAMAGLQSEIAGIALMAAAKVVEKEAGSKENEKIVDDFLKEAGV